MFDFLNFKLLPKVSCDSLSMDGYEAANLISCNESERMRGFVGFSTCKPPVNLDFTFICPISIKCLVLNTTNGSQKCTGIEIYVKRDSSSNFILVGKSFYDECGVVFSLKSDNETIYQNFYRTNFFPKKFYALLNVSLLRIKIIRTNRSIPCLSSVKVFAEPSKHCSKTTIETLNRLMSGPKHENKEEKPFTIPEDFKDDLTSELMTVPMTLPSGKTVDRSTLEKHAENENSYSRKPCDPFTGLKFTDVIKPVLNISLKARIDAFIFQNSYREELKKVQRTLGRFPSNSSAKTNTNDDVDENKSRGDLEEAIAGAKRSKGFVSFTGDVEDGNSCVKCAKKFEYLYEVPCKHYHCRECILIGKDDLKCSKCDEGFSSKDVKRVYL